MSILPKLSTIFEIMCEFRWGYEKIDEIIKN